MVDRRRYTGTRLLQVSWTGLVVLAVAVVEGVLSGPAPAAVTVGGGSVLWLAGLVALGIRERRHWNQLMAASSYDRAPAGHTADFQTIVGGKSVTATTDVAGLVSTEHTRIRAPVEGVDASFRIRIIDDELADADGLRTGVDALDERFTITGSESNVAAILTEDVRDALLTVEAPGTYTVSADRVVFEVPFTHVTAEELEAAGTAVAVLALRVEAVDQQ
jgi:hypothetical protein